MSINHGFPSRTYLNPVGNCIVGPGYNPNVFLGPDNLFGRSDVHAAAIGRHILRRADTLSLQDYQLWAQDSWKAEHGSPEAARRFANKLIEEHEEYNLALQNYLYEASDQNADDLVSEAGDVLWCLTSGLSNASESLEDSVQHYLFNLIKGTVIIQDGRPRNPSWRRKAISVATKNIRPVQTRDIDAMFAAGYIPQPSANMNLLEGEETEREEFRDDLRHRWIMTLSLLFTMSKLMHRQFGIHERFDDFFATRDSFCRRS